jgi:hypothetical protein
MSACAEKEGKAAVINAKLIAKSSISDEPAFELQIPEEYFIRSVDVQQAQSTSGIHTLFLWFLFPSLEGISDKTIKLAQDRIVPNSGVNLSLRVLTARDGEDIAARRFKALSHKLQKRPSPTAGAESRPGVTTYKYSTVPSSYAATFSQEDGTLVFIDCSLKATCKAVKTWQRRFVVEYYFHRAAFETDFRTLDDTINKLLHSFQPKRL